MDWITAYSHIRMALPAGVAVRTHEEPAALTFTATDGHKTIMGQIGAGHVGVSQLHRYGDTTYPELLGSSPTHHAATQREAILNASRKLARLMSQGWAEINDMPWWAERTTGRR